MAKFCGKCGSKLDEATGLCPKCDAEQLAKLFAESAKKEETGIPPEKPSSKKDVKKQKRADKKAARKAKKKEKLAGWSTGKKVCHFFLKFILIVLLCGVLAAGVTGALVYFGIVDIPEVSYILARSGLEKRKIVDGDPLTDNYIPEEDSIALDKESNLLYADNEILILFSNDATDAQKEAVILYLNGEHVGTVPELNMYQIKIRNGNTLEELAHIADKLMSEFDFIIYATYDTAIPDSDDAYSPNDPWDGDVSKSDWEDSSVDGSNWWMEAINAQIAWDYHDKFSQISIGICDSSFDTGHEDLKNKVSFPNKVLESRNVVTPWWYDSNNFKDLKKWVVTKQENYHGTHVAGIIGAEGDNRKGITGIVQNCELLLAPYYRNENRKAYLAWDSSTYANLSYLVKAGAKVINFSQGKTNFLVENTNKTAYGEDMIEREGHLASVSIAQLINSEYKDFIVVQSAGNGTGDTGKALDAIQNGWFASITDNSITGHDAITIDEVRSHVIIVGAAEQTSSGFQCASFSNYGDQVDICAPGVKIYSTIPSEIFYDFQFSGGYGYANGTSMSAPIVTGVCALTWSANPSLSAKEVKDIVCNNSNVKVNANPVSGDNHSYNMVNAGLSVEAALNHMPTGNDQLGQFEQADVPSDATEFNGHYYYVYDIDTVTDWNMAQEYCEAQGGYLATITSKEEDKFLYSYLKNNFQYENAYFGFTDKDEEGTWVWNNRESASYTNWHSGEPNGENSGEDYAMYYYKYPDGTWNDGDFGNRTVNCGTVFICEWGEYTVTPDNSPAQEPVRTTSDERDIVLVLDVSGSMAGTPMEETKKASINFVETILEEDASIGVVTYDNSASRASDFSVNKDSLKNIVSGLYDGGGTNIEAGLMEAQSMLNSSNAKKKIIVLMSDGEPNDGKEGDDLVAYAGEIKNSGVMIYTLGFFGNLGGAKSSAQTLMERIASDGCHYEVANADELVFFFGDIADQLNGQKYIYVRIACPVDVSVTYQGQTLNSAENDLSLRTDFGTLTFEENEEAKQNGTDDRIKVLRLKEGADYDLQLIGTGHGLMDYTIGFMDDEGNYSDLRKFEDIKITKRTVIDTVAATSKESTLHIDENGDGKYDLILRAGENGYGEEIKQDYLVYIIVGGCAVLLLVIGIILAHKMRTKKKER